MTALHPGQFQLFEPEDRIPRAVDPPRDLGVPDDFEPYETPHQYLQGWEGNPVYTQGARDEFDRMVYQPSQSQKLSWDPPDRADQWIHPPDVESPQRDVHPFGVDQLSHLEPDESQAVPNVNVWETNGRKVLMDGNHRLLAAQRRGNLWIGADVWE